MPGVDLVGVRQAVYFLRRVGLYQQGFMSREEVPVKEGQRVFVVGGGNTAMDAARTSLRLGASEVTVLYHRTQDRMSALKAEYDDAVAEGVKFMFETSIAEIRDTNGDGELDELVIDTNGVKTTIPANRVIQAVGSAPASRIVSTTEGYRRGQARIRAHSRCALRHDLAQGRICRRRCHKPSCQRGSRHGRCPQRWPKA